MLDPSINFISRKVMPKTKTVVTKFFDTEFNGIIKEVELGKEGQ